MGNSCDRHKKLNAYNVFVINCTELSIFHNSGRENTSITSTIIFRNAKFFLHCLYIILYDTRIHVLFTEHNVLQII